MNLVKKLAITLLTAAVIGSTTSCSFEPTNESIFIQELNNDANESFSSVSTFKITTENEKDLLHIKSIEHHPALYTYTNVGNVSVPLLMRAAYDDEFEVVYECYNGELKELPFELNKEIKFETLTDEEFQYFIDIVKIVDPVSVSELSN